MPEAGAVRARLNLWKPHVGYSTHSAGAEGAHSAVQRSVSAQRSPDGECMWRCLLQPGARREALARHSALG